MASCVFKHLQISPITSHLASRAAHQGKASQGHHAVHEGTVGAQGVIEELLHRGAEVQAASKHRDHLCVCVREFAAEEARTMSTAYTYLHNVTPLLPTT
eukprot:1148766-Pelagomonas_calceolata.AAC.12